MKKMVPKALKLRIYPNTQQIQLLEKHFGCVRYVYNYFLNLKKEEYLKNKKSLNKFECSKLLTTLKQDDKTSWLSEVNSQSLQAELEHLEVAYTRFFRKLSGFPKFKSKHLDIPSFKAIQNTSIDFQNQTIKIPKFKPIKFRGNTPDTEITPNSIVLSKNASGQYFASIQFEAEVEELSPVTQSIGLDLGITHFIVDSNGLKTENEKFSRKKSKKLKYIQRQHAKKKKGSKKRERSRKILAKLHNDIKNQRKDFQHKLSSKLVKENQIICLEDLNVKGMVKNHKLAGAISDASWSSFVSMLKYKAEWYGRKVVFVDRFFPSSKTCSECGFIHESMPLSIREFDCLGCGVHHDRDINAAKNILKQGLNILSGTGIVSDVKQKHGEALVAKAKSMKRDKLLNTV